MEGAGYCVHGPVQNNIASVTKLYSSAVQALFQGGIHLNDARTWPHHHPIRAPYRNREGAQAVVQDCVMDVIDIHPLLASLASVAITIKGRTLRRVHVRFPCTNNPTWSPPLLGWHVERGAGGGLSRTCIVHASTVRAGGGAVVVVVGSHIAVQRVLYSRLLPVCVRCSFLFHVALGYVIAFAAYVFRIWEIREVIAESGGVISMHPMLVHAPSRNVSFVPRLACQVKFYTNVPTASAL
jgi:hypothetical protein